MVLVWLQVVQIDGDSMHNVGEAESLEFVAITWWQDKTVPDGLSAKF